MNIFLSKPIEAGLMKSTLLNRSWIDERSAGLKVQVGFMKFITAYTYIGYCIIDPPGKCPIYGKCPIGRNVRGEM